MLDKDNADIAVHPIIKAKITVSPFFKGKSFEAK